MSGKHWKSKRDYNATGVHYGGRLFLSSVIFINFAM